MDLIPGGRNCQVCGQLSQQNMYVCQTQVAEHASHAQCATFCLGVGKGNICLLEPSWIAVRQSGGLG
eukprot:4143224-Ditylum_brightwellii.AAC.1